MAATKTEIKRRLQDMINELVTPPCMFRFCPGPNRAVEPMATCRLCYAVKDLRKIKKDM